VIRSFGSVQKSPSSPVLRPLEGKAAASVARGAYGYDVSTENWRERRWRLFSTDPKSNLSRLADGCLHPPAHLNLLTSENELELRDRESFDFQGFFAGGFRGTGDSFFFDFF